MYSRTPHDPPRLPGPDGGLREPGYRRTRPVILPPNYSGSAFAAAPEDAPEPPRPAAHQSAGREGDGRNRLPALPEREAPPEPRFDGLPQVSTLPGVRLASPRPSAAARAAGGTEAAVSGEEEGSVIGGEDTAASGTTEAPAGAGAAAASDPSARPEPEGRAPDPGAAPRLPLPSLPLIMRFPFDHGIGYEELLLLGLILLILNESGADGMTPDGGTDTAETLLLLGALLLFG